MGLALTALVALVPVLAARGAAPVPTLREAVRAAAIPPAPSAQAPAREQPEDRARGWRFRWLPGPSLRYGDDVRVDFHARVQIDAADDPVPHEGDDEDSSALDVARRRVGIEGELVRVLEFQVERELASDDPWRDVFVNYRQFAAVRVQGGKFKLPFSLEANMSPTNLDFIHRSRAATELAPGRDVGVMVHGRPFTRVFRYEVGLFERDGDNARTRNVERVAGGTTLAGRITVQPFAGTKSPLADLRAGVAATTSELAEGFPALRGRSALDAPFFRADVWVNGRRRRTGVEVRWRPGPFSVQSEYIRVEDQRRGESVEDTDLSPLVASGWYVSGTWAITGERKASGLDEPRRPFLQHGGTGAVEVAARIEALRFRSAAEDEPPSTSPRANVIVGNELQGATLGVNWYLNRWVKVQANAIRERIEDPLQGPLPDRAIFWSSVLRLQLSF